MNVASQGYDAKKISCFSKNVSQAMKLHNYSIVELLIKLKLIYSDLLKHGRLSKVQSSPLYFERTSDGLLQSNAAEQQEFLNELMNAPLDDIAIYLENIGKQFEQFYTTDIIEQLIDRIGYGNHNVRIDSNDILDQLFILIIKPMARKYSRLTGLQLITYIDNKYHSTETDKYRVLLERFVETNPQPQFTFANFYRMVNIRPLFDSKQETLLSDLFTIYCQKILDIDKKKCFLEKGDFQEIRPRQYRKMQEQITGRDNFQKIAQSTRSRKCKSCKTIDHNFFPIWREIPWENNPENVETLPREFDHPHELCHLVEHENLAQNAGSY